MPSTLIDDQALHQFGQQVFEIEARVIDSLKDHLDASFVQACRCLLACKGRIVLAGLGKSGHIARKIASTFASTGSPSFFIHAAEANHGDAGMLTSQDVLIAISNSGETAELINLLPFVRRLGIPLICLSGAPHSTLAKAATIYLSISVSEEACPLGLAPTSSTTVSLVLGDALAITLLKARDFTADDFALYHPGGQLGRRLLLKVGDIMRTGESIPRVVMDAKLQDALIEMTQKRLGFTTVLNGEGQLLGIYTDGDVRRSLEREVDVYSTAVCDVMTTHPKTISSDKLAAEALHLMELHKITGLCVTDENRRMVGVVHIHDLLEAGLA